MLSADFAFGFDFFTRPFLVSDQVDTIAAIVEFNYVHIRAYKQQSPSACFIEIFATPRVRNNIGVEALTFVGHRNLDPPFIHKIIDFNLFLRVHFIAVPDGIDERLFHRQMDGEDVVLTKIVGL